METLKSDPVTDEPNLANLARQHMWLNHKLPTNDAACQDMWTCHQDHRSPHVVLASHVMLFFLPQSSLLYSLMLFFSISIQSHPSLLLAHAFPWPCPFFYMINLIRAIITFTIAHHCTRDFVSSLKLSIHTSDADKKKYYSPY